MEKEIFVIKEDGSREKFRPSKVRRALRRSGMDANEVEEALDMLYPQLEEGMATKKIYALVFRIIRELRPEVGHRYNLKRALLLLGPAGYFFEDYVGKLFAALGYEIAVRQVPTGKCITHEVDVIARKGREKLMVECKFRNQPGDRCRIQTALYIYARFLDLRDGARIYSKNPFSNACLVTNAKFSGDAIAYSECMGMRLIGWRYPLKESLEVLIDRTRCYPVSVIRMSPQTLHKLLKKGVTTVDDVPATAKKLRNLTGISLSNAARIVREASLANGANGEGKADGKRNGAKNGKVASGESGRGRRSAKADAKKKGPMKNGKITGKVKGKTKTGGKRFLNSSK